MLIHAHHFFRSMRAYIRLKLLPYDMEPLLKVLKHFIYIQRRPAKSMNWMGGVNHMYPHKHHVEIQPKD